MNPKSECVYGAANVVLITAIWLRYGHLTSASASGFAAASASAVALGAGVAGARLSIEADSNSAGLVCSAVAASTRAVAPIGCCATDSPYHLGTWLPFRLLMSVACTVATLVLEKWRGHPSDSLLPGGATAGEPSRAGSSGEPTAPAGPPVTCPDVFGGGVPTNPSCGGTAAREEAEAGSDDNGIERGRAAGRNVGVRGQQAAPGTGEQQRQDTGMGQQAQAAAGGPVSRPAGAEQTLLRDSLEGSDRMQALEEAEPSAGGVSSLTARLPSSGTGGDSSGPRNPTTDVAPLVESGAADGCADGNGTDGAAGGAAAIAAAEDDTARRGASLTASAPAACGAEVSSEGRVPKVVRTPGWSLVRDMVAMRPGSATKGVTVCPSASLSLSLSHGCPHACPPQPRSAP